MSRRSLGNSASNPDSLRKRRSLEDSSLPFKKVYPDLFETTSYASTTYTRTSEIADDEEEYETEADSSFESSRASEGPENGMYPMWKCAVAAVFVILLGFSVGLMLLGKNKHNKQADSNYEKYIKSVRSVISTQFPDVSKDNREILRLIGQKVYLEPENTAPLVILVGGTEGRHFSEAISGIIYNLAAEHSENLASHRTIRVESDTNRAELHEIVKRALSPPSQSSSTPSPRTAVVLDVDLLKWDAVLVLHAFADHEKYPVPKTVLFLTVSSQNQAHNESSDENCDGKMVDFLTNQWIENGGSSDNIPPIIARISYFICV